MNGVLAVMISVRDWFGLLQQIEPLTGIPLVMCGLALMLLGWRMWKVCVGLTFGLIGYVVGSALAGSSEQQVVYSLVGAVALGLASLGPVGHAVSLLGGIAGSFVVMNVLAAVGLGGPALWIAGAVALIGLTALSSINRRHVVILLTSFEGAALLVSGLVVLSRLTPDVHGVIRHMATGSAIAAPFILLVPMVMGVFYQLSEVRRTGTEM